MAKLDAKSTSKIAVNPYALTGFRELAGLKKSQLAAQAEMGLGYLCDLETGRRPGTPDVIRRIASVLKINLLALIQNPNDFVVIEDEAAA